MNDKDLELEELSLEQIMKEFGQEDAPEQADLEDTQDLLGTISEIAQEPETQPEPEVIPEPVPEVQPETPAEVVEAQAEDTIPAIPDLSELETPDAEATRKLPDISSWVSPVEEKDAFDDTVRLDDLSKIVGTAPSFKADREESDVWTGEEDEDSVEIRIPAPIKFRPRQRLRDLKRELIAGPEKRYYELSEKGVGKLQLAMLVCLLVVLAALGAGLMYGAGMVPENRLRLMVFGQVLAMLIGALMGSHLMIDGLGDLFRGRFSLNTLLVVTFLASSADAALCLQEQRVPLCAAFTLEVLMALWNAYHRRTTEMGQMDTMRKAVRLDSVVRVEEYLDGKAAYLRGEGQVSDFMEHYDEVPRPERTQNIYAFVAMLISLGIAAYAFVFHGMSMGVQIFSTSLLVAVPATFFVTVTRPIAMLERKLHRLGTVLCGWRGISGFSGKAMFPLLDSDFFPAAGCKLNGVKFYGQRAPEVVISYATALMAANGGSLAATFEELLTSRNGIRHEADNLQFYGNGGIGGEICQEPVLMGSLDFLKEMGVEIPEGTMVKQAVYVSIDGELSGLFAISYPLMKFTASGLATLCGNRKLSPVILAKDFMITGPFLKEKFGVRTKRMIFPARQLREELAAKQPEEAVALALTTQEGLAPVAYAITGSRAVRTAAKLGLVIHMMGGILGLLIMAALAYLGNTELLTPLNILAYQLVWAVPGLLATFWTRTI